MHVNCLFLVAGIKLIGEDGLEINGEGRISSNHLVKINFRFEFFKKKLVEYAKIYSLSPI